MTKRINGIQQMGVGVENIDEAFKWFRQNFNMNIRVFDEKAVAKLMLPHTGGEPRERHALLAINMQGGGGFEVWQHTGRKPLVSKREILLGDLGVCITKMKTFDVEKTYKIFKSKGLNLLSTVQNNPIGTPHFYMKDPFGNTWEFVQDPYLLSKNDDSNGGVFGATIGVKNIEESLPVYSDILGYDKILYDHTDTFTDWKGVAGSDAKFRRMILKPSAERTGAFSPLLGPSEIELVQVDGREPIEIYKDRMWGDPGFIHLCFDIQDMNEMREEAKQKGFPFTVDSARQGDTFDMGEAAGGFAYIQAPEGTLIEFVETQKVPIMQKWGLNIDLRKRNPNKPLPHWLLLALKMKKVKD